MTSADQTPEPDKQQAADTDERVELTVEQAIARTKQIEQANANRIQELARLGRGLDPTAVLNQKIETLMAVMVPPDARVFVELEFNRAMQQQLEQALSETRQSQLLGGGTPKGGLIVPKR